MDSTFDLRVGNGFDVHRLVADRPCIICGVNIPFDRGLLGHSDADVALHALADALLGAVSMRDIGYHFPDTDERWRGADSRMLLREVVKIIAERGYMPSNVDITIIAQAPKMLPFIEQMQANVAADLGLEVDRVSVKATTTERLGFTGREEGIASLATATVIRR
ncbi:MAG: 2-C-methyl-D-erythritol 2,4-cyclodiphosphate synthase [Muribaculaceae bacterium]|nr:2-C-methyl-D-erythritol 2,4-cyclodiphosphate synthase [Muribaculaceae bacterium]